MLQTQVYTQCQHFASIIRLSCQLYMYIISTFAVHTKVCMRDVHVPTPSQEAEEPPFLADITEHHNDLEVEHHSLTQHPAEGSQ